MATHTKFFKRMIKLQHMEFDAAAQQVLWALVSPKKLYRHHEAHYKTRDSWSRDDPAFLVCICVFLAMSTFGYSLFLRLGVGGFLLSLLLTELLDCILSGVIVASIMWVVCNKILMKKNSKEMVEWGYCFDVHLNAFVPLAVTVFGIQMVLVTVMGRLQNTVYLLSPVLPLLALCVISIPLQWNYTSWFVHYYRLRVGQG